MGVWGGVFNLINRTFFQICPQFNRFIHSFWGVIHIFSWIGVKILQGIPPIFSRLYAIFFRPIIQRFLNTVQIAVQHDKPVTKRFVVQSQFLTGIFPRFVKIGVRL